MPRKYLFYVAQNYSYAILRPLQAAIQARGDEAAWFLHGNELNTAYLRADERRLYTVAEVINWSPDACFVPGNMIPSFIPGLKVGIFHGFNVGKMNRRGHSDHFNIRGCFDLYCTQGPNTTETFQGLAQQYGYFNVAQTGWPAMDPLFLSYPAVSPKTVKSTSQMDRPTIIMCSTFSRHLTCAPHLYNEVKRLSQNDKWRWLVQFHPKMDQETVTQYKNLQNDNLTFVETDDVIPLLQQADVMLCDTSSILLMFILQNKPVVTFNNGSPGPHLLNFTEVEQLEAKISHALSRPPELMSHIENFIDELHPYQDGQSSERVLNAVAEVLAGKHPTRQKKPRNWIRQFKARRELNYWKW